MRLFCVRTVGGNDRHSLFRRGGRGEGMVVKEGRVGATCDLWSKCCWSNRQTELGKACPGTAIHCGVDNTRSACFIPLSIEGGYSVWLQLVSLFLPEASFNTRWLSWPSPPSNDFLCLGLQIIFLSSRIFNLSTTYCVLRISSRPPSK